MNGNDEKVAKIESDIANIDNLSDISSQLSIGLRGLSNACSLNSILQVLFHINIFKHYIFYLRQSRVSSSYIALELQKIFIQLEINEYTPSVRQLLFKLKIQPDELAKYNDPIIYLHRIYNILRNDDFFRDLFVGSVSKLNKSAYFLTLSLNVELGDNIESIFNQMYSSMQFNRFPPIIFLNLDRFHDSNANHKFVEFPENLDLTSYSATNSQSNYELYSVIVHSGMDKNGHYFVYIKDFILNKWVLYDDSKVKITSEDSAIKENFGGNDKHYSAKILVYFDISAANTLFEADTEDFASSWIKNTFSSKDGKNKLSLSFENDDSQTNKEYKINVVQVDDITNYVDSESSIKFTSDKYISVFEKDTVKELYNKMSDCIEIPAERLTIWIIFRSVLSMKLLREYDNQILSNIIEPMKNVQFFVEEIEDDSEEEEEEEEDANDYDHKPKLLNEEANKKKRKQKGKETNSENEDNSILVFLFTYNYMSSHPLKFHGTVIVNFNENIQVLFNLSRSTCGIKADVQMMAFQIIESKCYLIPDPSKTVGSLELNDGSIIVVQPNSSVTKGGGNPRPKKPKTAHNIFTYCPDYINKLPHSFSIYYEYRRDPYNLPVKFNNQLRMVQFPKSINCEDFKNFVLKAFNYDLNPLNESILFYSKKSTKPIDLLPSSKIGDQLNKLGIDDNLSQLYLVKVFSNEINRYYNMVRLKIKMISSTPKKGITEFFDKEMNMLEVVNELKERHQDLSEYFILPLNSKKEIIQENFIIENIRNPIYLNLRLPTESYVTMILIVKGKEIKELDVRVKSDDTFLDFKKSLNIDNPKDARFYSIGDNGNQKNISDSQLMKKYSHFKTIVYFEAPFIPHLLDNMIIRPLSNTSSLTYKSQIFPLPKKNQKENNASNNNNLNELKIKKETDFAPRLVDNSQSNFENIDDPEYLVQSEYENDHLLINDQFDPDLIESNETNIGDYTRQFNKIFPMKEDIHLVYADNIVPLFSDDSQLEETVFNKAELLKNYYYKPKMKRPSPPLNTVVTTTTTTTTTNNNNNNNNSNNNNATTTDDDKGNKNESLQVEEKRGRGRPKKSESIKKKMEENEKSKTENETEYENKRITNQNENEVKSKENEEKNVKKSEIKEEENKNEEIIKEINNSSNNNEEDDDTKEIDNNNNDDDNNNNESSIEADNDNKKDENEENQKLVDDLKNEEEIYRKYMYDYKSDNEINYDENEDEDDDDEDDDDDAASYDVAFDEDDDDDYEIEGYDDEDEINYSKKGRKQQKTKKKKNKNDEKNYNNNNNNGTVFGSAIPIITAAGSIGTIYRSNNNNASFFAGQPLIIRGNHAQIAPQIHAQIAQPVQSGFIHKKEIGNVDENDQMVVILKPQTLMKIRNNNGDVQTYGDGQRNIELAVHGDPKFGKIIAPMPQIPQVSPKFNGYPNQQRIEIGHQMNQFHQRLQEVQQDQQNQQQQQQQQQDQRQLMQKMKLQNQQQQQQQQQFQSEMIQSRLQQQQQNELQQQQQQQKFKGGRQQQQSSVVYNYSKPLQQSVMQPIINQQSQNQKQQQQQQQQQNQQQQYQPMQQQQAQPHPQPQIRSQQQKQPNVQVYSYSRQLPEVQQQQQQQHGYQSNGSEVSSQQNSKKKRHGSNSNHSQIDEIIINAHDEPIQSSEGRRKAKNDGDFNQNSNSQKEPNQKASSTKNRHAKFVDLNVRPNNSVQIEETQINVNNRSTINAIPNYQLNAMKMDNNVGYIHDPRSYNNFISNNSSIDSSFSRIGNEYFSDASARLQFPKNIFLTSSVRLMPTNETELALNSQTDDNRKQKDQNNRNISNDPYMSQYSRFSDFPPSNDDFFHPL